MYIGLRRKRALRASRKNAMNLQAILRAQSQYRTFQLNQVLIPMLMQGEIFASLQIPGVFVDAIYESTFSDAEEDAFQALVAEQRTTPIIPSKRIPLR